MALAQVKMSATIVSIIITCVVIELLGTQFFFSLLPPKMDTTDGIIFRLCSLPFLFLSIYTLTNEFQPVSLAECSAKDVSIANRYDTHWQDLFIYLKAIVVSLANMCTHSKLIGILPHINQKFNILFPLSHSTLLQICSLN